MRSNYRYNQKGGVSCDIPNPHFGDNEHEPETLPYTLSDDEVGVLPPETEIAPCCPKKLEAVQTSRASHDAREYLASTDWYIVRKMERDVDIPPEVITKRAEAVKVLN